MKTIVLVYFIFSLLFLLKSIFTSIAKSKLNSFILAYLNWFLVNIFILYIISQGYTKISNHTNGIYIGDKIEPLDNFYPFINNVLIYDISEAFVYILFPILLFLFMKLNYYKFINFCKSEFIKSIKYRIIKFNIKSYFINKVSAYFTFNHKFKFSLLSKNLVNLINKYSLLKEYLQIICILLVIAIISIYIFNSFTNDTINRVNAPKSANQEIEAAIINRAICDYIDGVDVAYWKNVEVCRLFSNDEIQLSISIYLYTTIPIYAYNFNLLNSISFDFIDNLSNTFRTVSVDLSDFMLGLDDYNLLDKFLYKFSTPGTQSDFDRIKYVKIRTNLNTDYLNFGQQQKFGFNEASLLGFHDCDSLKLYQAKSILNILNSENFSYLSQYVHPELGIQFTSYSSASLDTVFKFARSELIEAFNSDSLYRIYLGTSDDVEYLSFKDYVTKVIYNRNYTNAFRLGNNFVLNKQNTIKFISTTCNDCYFIDCYFPWDENRNEFGWNSLRLVFRKKDNISYLIEVNHDEWTP